MSVRFIDWGYSRSDLVFGPRDNATSFGSDESHRLRLTQGKVWPSEFHDMASVLTQLRAMSHYFDGTRHCLKFLEEAFAVLMEEADRWTRPLKQEELQSLSSHYRILPACLFRVDGSGMYRFVNRLFPRRQSSFAPECLLPDAPMRLYRVPSSKKLDQVLDAAITKRPYVLESNAPQMSRQIMHTLAMQQSQGMKPDERDSFVSFFERQILMLGNLCDMKRVWNHIGS
jgi:hypothetical protein